MRGSVVITAVSDPRQANIRSKVLKTELLRLCFSRHLGCVFWDVWRRGLAQTMSQSVVCHYRLQKQIHSTKDGCIFWFLETPTSGWSNPNSSHGCCINGLFGQGGRGIQFRLGILSEIFPAVNGSSIREVSGWALQPRVCAGCSAYANGSNRKGVRSKGSKGIGL